MTGVLRYLTTIAAVCAALGSSAADNVINLAGRWGFSTTKDNVTDSVSLPGTLDTNGIGTPNTNMEETTQLSRKVTYAGPAYYTRTVHIPREWDKKSIQLSLERTRPSTLWVDGKEIGSVSNISTPHIYDLTGILTPGSHEITILVDNGNRMPEEIKVSSHAATESTQTNWNGILGDMTLSARNPLHIADVQPYPDVAARSVKLNITLSDGKKLNGKKLIIKHGDRKKSELKLRDGIKTYDVNVDLGRDARTWSEHDPYLHDITVMIAGIDTVKEKVGLREFTRKNRHFYINDTLTFLRGTHDGCVFPLTAYAPMDTESWIKYFRTIKDYGLNHVRFHSWCPPEAAFEAADIEGIYLQPELPIWGSFDNANQPLMDFLMADGEAIHKLYSRHPSFVLFALGNELWGEAEVMRSFVDHYRSADPRHLYTFGSNAFCGWNGFLPGQEFFVTCRIGGGEGYSTQVRASFAFVDADEGGIMNNTYPDTKKNFENAVLLCPEPVIGHETGQYQVYPDYREIEKYTGVLEPRNLEVFRRRLADANMLGQAHDFFTASGKWSAELYKADMELNFRTPSMGGFQLLDIKDYPGQGTALVGMLDSFMDSKGLITPERWRESCDEIVALAEYPSYTWTSGDRFNARLAVSNYSGNDISGDSMVVKLMVSGKPVFENQFAIPDGQGYVVVDSITTVFSQTDTPVKAELNISIPAKNVRNSYPLWVYPADRTPHAATGVMVSKSLSDAETGHLRKGGTLVLSPRREYVDSATVGGLFTTDYWNYRMFKTISENNGKPVSPGTLGILTDPDHPALSQFPTESHTNWQWYPIVKNSYPLILDRLNDIDYRPIVQVIDNVERNHRLGMVMEFAVEKGKLLLIMADTDQLNKYPEGEQFMKSLIEYAGSTEFNPATVLTIAELQSLLTNPSETRAISTLRNISYD